MGGCKEQEQHGCFSNGKESCGRSGGVLCSSGEEKESSTSCSSTYSLLSSSSTSSASTARNKNHNNDLPIRTQVVKFHGNGTISHDDTEKNGNKHSIRNISSTKNEAEADFVTEQPCNIRKKQNKGNLLTIGGENEKANHAGAIERICKERLSNREYFRAWDKFTSSGSDDDDDNDDEDIIIAGATTTTRNINVTVIREEKTNDEEEDGLMETFREKLNMQSLTKDEQKFLATREKDKGNECYRMREYEMAIDHYSKSIVLDAENAVVYANRAMAYIRCGGTKTLVRALDDCNKALDLDPGYTKALARRRQIYQMNGRHRDALRDFADCVRMEPVKEEYEKLWIEAKKHTTSPDSVEENDEKSKKRIVIIEDEGDEDVNEDDTT